MTPCNMYAVSKLNRNRLTNAIKESALKISDGPCDILQATSLDPASRSFPFFSEFENEISRLTLFIVAQHGATVMSAKSLLSQCLDNEGVDVGTPGSAKLRSMAEELVDCCLQMERFVVANKGGLREVAAEADAQLNTGYCTALLERSLEAFPWTKNLNSGLIVLLNDIFDVIRSSETKSDDHSSTWQAPSSFERTTSKFWVGDEKLTDLLLTCAQEAPLLVYGHTGRLTTKEDLYSKDKEEDQLWTKAASRISSVYFDSPNMHMYKERIRRSEGAKLFRVRWYGSRKPSGSQPVFLELKTHHEKWVNTKSVKERVTILEKDLKTVLARVELSSEEATSIVQEANSSLQGEALEKAVNLLVIMHNLVVKLDLRPCVRSTYYRVAFQSPKSNALRITVDRNVTLFDERSAYPHSWCLPDDAIMESSMIVKIPYSVFELKLSGSEAPGRIEALKDRGVIIDAEKFSKFLTGAAAFNKSRVNMLPYWAEHPSFVPIFEPFQPNQSSNTMDTSIPKQGRTPSLRLRYGSTISSKSKDRTGRTAEDLTSVTVETVNDPPFKTVRIFSRRSDAGSTLVAPKTPARVEPKSYFANERTLIQWISASLLLVTISVILLDFQTTHTYPIMAGLVLIGCAALIVLYAMFVYYRRIRLLESGSSYGYVDRVGPFLLALAVLMGVVALFIYFLREQVDVPWLTGNGKLRESTSDGCILRDTSGVSMLEFQPSDIYVDSKRNLLLVPSLNHITAISRAAHEGTAGVSVLAEIPNSDLEAIDLEAITCVGDRVFAISEGRDSQLIELEWTSDGSYNLNVVQRWRIPTEQAEGIAYVPATSHDSKEYLYVAGDNKDASPADRGHIDVYEVPPRGSTKMELSPRRLNQNLLNKDLLDSKPASLYFFEGILYVLHDNEKLVRAWNIEKGILLAQWKLPALVNGFDKQWEGMALERRSPDGKQSGRSLRSTSATSSDLILHLSLDTPAQIWSLNVREGAVEGDIVFPGCANG